MLEFSKCHRAFLDSYLRLHELTYKELQHKTKNAISSTTLHSILKKNTKGKYVDDYMVSLEKWTRLVSYLKLTPDEALKVLLLRLKDSVRYLNSRRLRVSMDVLEKLESGIGKQLESKEVLSARAFRVGQVFEKFPEKLKIELTEQLLNKIDLLKVVDRSRGETFNELYKSLKK